MKLLRKPDIRKPEFNSSKSKSMKFYVSSNKSCPLEYVESVATESGVFSKKWESKALKKLQRSATRLISKKIKERFINFTDSNEKLSCTFSVNAGCSCGCSPGFIMKGVCKEHFGKSAFLAFEVEKDDTDVLDVAIEVFKKEYAQELKEQEG